MLVVNPVRPSGAKRSIVGSGTVTLTVPARRRRPGRRGAPRCGGLYVGCGGGLSSRAAAGASFCASAVGGIRHAAAITATANAIVRSRITANCRSAGTAPNKPGARSAGRRRGALRACSARAFDMPDCRPR